MDRIDFFCCVALFFLKKYKTEIFISSMKYDKGDEKLLRKLIFFILFQSSEGERRRFFFVCIHKQFSYPLSMILK